MQIVPATSKVRAVVRSPDGTLSRADVVAWGIVEEGPTPPRPIVAPVPPGVRVAVPIDDTGVLLFEWPARTHANEMAFATSAA